MTLMLIPLCIFSQMSPSLRTFLNTLFENCTPLFPSPPDFSQQHHPPGIPNEAGIPVRQPYDVLHLGQSW